MKRLIAPCGLDCGECRAYQASQSGDHQLKQLLAAEWSTDACKFEASEINCAGCMQSSWKMTEACEIRKCVTDKHQKLCACCDDYRCDRLTQPAEYMDRLKQAYDLASSSKIAYLSSVDEEGYPVTRAMLNMEINGLETIWFSTNTPSPKVAQFMHNSKACVTYSDNTEYKGLTLVGDIEVLHDDESKRRLWREGFERYYPRGVTDPDYCVLRFHTKWGSYYHKGLLEFRL